MHIRLTLANCLLLAVIWSGSCSRQAASNLDPKQLAAEFQKLTQERLDANLANNRDYYERLLTADFRFLYPDGQVKSKKEYLDGEHFVPEMAGRRGSPATISGIQVSVDRETAIVTYQVVEHLPFAAQQFDRPLIHLDTYIRRENEWKLATMSVASKVFWPDTVKIDKKLLDEYSGKYELTADTQIVVTNESGHLMAQMTGQDKAELFPENETSFFDKTDENTNARSIFVRDKTGKVISMDYVAFGQRIRATRIK